MAGLLTSSAMCEGSLGFSFLFSFTYLGWPIELLLPWKEALWSFAAKGSLSGAEMGDMYPGYPVSSSQRPREALFLFTAGDFQV
jgi:hypothetical protein